MLAAPYIARGTLRVGSFVSPTWQAAASNAGAAKPIRYRPAIALVTAPKTPWNGVSRWKEVARCQSTVPARTGMRIDSNASPADANAMGIATRVAHFTPIRLTTVKTRTIAHARRWIGTNGRYHSCRAVAERIAVRPH